MLRLLLLLLLVAVQPALRFPCLPASAAQDAAGVDAPPGGREAHPVAQYVTVEEDATLILMGPALRYLPVAPLRYVRMVQRALHEDLTRCICQNYVLSRRSPSADAHGGAAANSSLAALGEVHGCSIHRLSLFTGFRDDPQQLAVSFTVSLMTPSRDGDGQTPAAPPGTTLSLPDWCFPGMQGALAKLTRHSGRQSLQHRTVYFGPPPPNPAGDGSSVGLFEALFSNALSWLAVAVLAVSGLMVLVTALCMGCRRCHASDGAVEEEEAGPAGVVNGVVIPDSTRHGLANSRDSAVARREPGASWRKGGDGRRASKFSALLRR
ncbi:uncharacterized protein Tco025E_05116 [Trypanosoma conorhini]|uniref:Uncharacterized protein n=1 Tax=Trypanosoma conorhini TaxID=83891 RepID=A0A422PFY1_9TRYP|nr:uncharacterized protein Tco025E_05116 [Trypanosoma conorhini]RNF16615.1 hypothetical protein Tco025E_05116 [Trypanosoma conorhini]